MRDLIDRQAAIDICNSAIDLWHGQLGEGALVAVKEKIEGVPSAQPDVPDTNVGDMISRKGILRAFEEMCSCTDYGWDERDFRDLIKKYPSAESEYKELQDWKTDFKGFIGALDMPRDDYRGIMEYIDEVPSAEPERILVAQVTLSQEQIQDAVDKAIEKMKAELEPCDFCKHKDDCGDILAYCPAERRTDE